MVNLFVCVCLCFCYYVCVWNGLMPLLVECGFIDRSVGRGLRFNTTTTCSLPSLPLFPYGQSYYHCACFSERVCVCIKVIFFLPSSSLLSLLFIIITKCKCVAVCLSANCNTNKKRRYGVVFYSLTSVSRCEYLTFPFSICFCSIFSQ